MVTLKTDLCGLEIDNPVIPASGTFGYGREFAELYDINVLGTFSIKGTTAAPRFGNPTPRIAECDMGMLNSVGLQNPGADKVVSEELPAIEKLFKKKVIANLCGESIDEYREVAEKFDDCQQVGWMEVNISCPNVKSGGIAFGTDPRAAASLIDAVRKSTRKPVIAKLTPNVTDITEIARACEDAGADGITAINTLLGMRIDPESRKPILANITGGLSGPAVFPIAVRAVWQIARAVDIPVIGCGGVSSARDVIEMMMAGASAVQVGSANLTDPFVCKKIIEELPGVMERYGIADFKELKEREEENNG